MADGQHEGDRRVTGGQLDRSTSPCPNWAYFYMSFLPKQSEEGSWYSRNRRRSSGMGRFTRMVPNAVSQAVCLFAMFWLADTFGQLGAPSITDRCVVILGAMGPTGLLIVKQVEQPTIELLRCVA